MAVDLSRFTKPNLQIAEVVLPTLTAIPTPILPAAFTNRGRRWVKRFILSAYDLADDNAPAAVDTFLLDNVLCRWWLRRKEEASGQFWPMLQMDNATWQRGGLQGCGAGPTIYELGWDLDHPVVVKDNDTMYVDWSNRAVAAGGAVTLAGNAWISAHGYGLQTGKPRVLRQFVAWAVNVVPNPATGTSNPGQDAQAQFGEDVVIEKIRIHTDSGQLNIADARYLNHIAIRVRFDSQTRFAFCGRNQGDIVPLIGYGSHLNTDAGVAIYEPGGEPLILESNDAVGWEFTNPTAWNLRMQVIVVSLLEE